MSDITIKEVERLRLQPGDSIVVHLDQHLVESSLLKLKANLREALGSDHKIFVFPKGMRMSVVGDELPEAEPA